MTGAAKHRARVCTRRKWLEIKEAKERGEDRPRPNHIPMTQFLAECDLP